MTPPLDLAREQILAFRRRVQSLDERMPMAPDSLRRAAWAGLTDSMPRAALLSIHARVSDTHPASWENSALVQVWGPRYSTYVIPAQDVAVFTLGRVGTHSRTFQRGSEIAAQLKKHLRGGRKTDRDAGPAMGMHPNALRYASLTATVLIRWEGARAPLVWTIPEPSMTADEARLELARRYLHFFGPNTPASFASWAGAGPADAEATFASLASELVPVRTPVGDGWILATDEPTFRETPASPAAARLLPSGDSYWLYWGANRSLLVSDPDQQAQVWTSRVWPGALLVDGEIVGTWRRAGARVDVTAWRDLSVQEREAVEAESATLPLPGVAGAITVRWTR